MIAIIVGTTAELIKVAPVYHELTSRGRSCEFWYTGQHVAELAETLEDLQLPKPAVWLVPEESAINVARTSQVPGWVARLVTTTTRRRRELRRRLASDGRPAIVLVHGDTFTAPIGAVIGRLLGARIGHVEAGMRSGHLFQPFPEEVNRRVAAHLVDVHFAPTQVEAGNLRRRRGVIVTTGANTVIDAVRFALEREAETPLDLPDTYGIATLHRFELVRQEKLYRAVLETLAKYSATCPIVYFAGASERERLREFGLLDLFGDTFRLVDKLSYIEFLPVLARAQFVVTDSGGLQEESYHLGLPCAVHRTHTERMNGEGRSMVLTRYDQRILRDFLVRHDEYTGQRLIDDVHPSRIVADTIELLDSAAKA